MRSLREKWLGLLGDLRAGRTFGIPRCCRVQWSVERALLDEEWPREGFLGRRGVRSNQFGPYIPCPWHMTAQHKEQPTHEEGS